MTLHGKALRHWSIISAMILLLKTLRTSMTLWPRNHVQKFDVDTILFSEIQSNKMFNTLATFSVRFKLKSGEICKNHTCLFHCNYSCRVPRTIFE